MNVLSFENYLSTALYRQFKPVVHSIILNHPQMNANSEHELNKFILHIRNKIGKIYNYVIKDFKTEPKIIKATSENFIFIYTINPDNSSKFEVCLLIKADRKFDHDLITDKIKDVEGYVYFLKSDYGFKIGCTSNITKRINLFAVKLPFKTELHSFVKTSNYSLLESQLHGLLKDKRINGEWFDISEYDFIELDMVLNNLGHKRELK